jgi:uncharacterized membrane protein YoaK (UPF0700 family)
MNKTAASLREQRAHWRKPPIEKRNYTEETRNSRPVVSFIKCVLPLRRPDSSRASASEAVDARAASPGLNAPSRPSSPNFNPVTRPSIVPNASLLPGMHLHVHSVLLSAVAGYVDAVGFAALIKLFPAHMTGEIIGEALAFSSDHPAEHLTQLWMLPVFVAAVSVAALVARVRRRSGKRALTSLLALVTAALALFSASQLIARLLHEGPQTSLLLGGMCAVAGMGFQNALMRESLAASCPTTVMTGNLTQVIIEVVDHVFRRLSKRGKRDRKPRGRLAPVATALLAFIACAVLGGFLTRSWGAASAIVPTAITLLLTVRAWREDRAHAIIATLVTGIVPLRLPSFEVWPESLIPRAAPETAAARSEAERPPMKRTISGTQRSQRLRDGDQ